MDLDKFMEISDWKQPCNWQGLICHAYITFRATCSDRSTQFFNSISYVTISRVELEKNSFNRIETLKNEKIQNILLPSLKEYVINQLDKNCLGYPKCFPYKEEARWVISPERAEKINDYWRSMAKEENEEIFLIPVKDVEVWDPKTNQWEKLKWIR